MERMKFDRLWSQPLLILCLTTLAFSQRLASATLSEGFAIIDYDEAAWNLLAAESGLEMPVMTLSAFFNQAEANGLDYTQVLKEPQAVHSYTGQKYAMNGPTVVNRTGRTTQPTTFSFTPGGLTHHEGRIGLGGIARFAVNGGGNLLFGDLTLQYDDARLKRGGSGWYLRGNIPPVGPLYDLMHVTINETPSSITIAGDLGVTFEIANLLYSTPADTLRDIGDFRFQAKVSPDSGSRPRLSLLPQQSGQWILQLSEGVPQSTFTVLSSSGVSEPSGDWQVVAVGSFDSKGNGATAITINVSETSRLYRVEVP